MKTTLLNNWIRKQKKINNMEVSRVNFNEMDKWIFDQSKIYNKNKNFFSIFPYKFTKNNKFFFYQPLIIQKEVGILGILKKKINFIDYYLLQAKVEPGNVNNIQLSPTVQATKSNFLQKHGGKKTRYLDFFIRKNSNTNIITNLKLSEQGTRYYEKFNQNILIDIKKKKLKSFSNFIWVTKENLISLIKRKNFLNMDTISVLSGSIKPNLADYPENHLNIIIKKINDFKKKNKLIKEKIHFDKLKNWKIFKDKIYDINKDFFSIIALSVKTNSREVRKWDQPIISDHSTSINGFLLKNINNTNHYLLQVVQEPGFNFPKFTSTICIKNYNLNKHYKNHYINFFKKKNVLMNVVNSDEGGRFFKNETRNIISIVSSKKKIITKNNYIWASHNQIVSLISRNLLSIESRNLFASFNIDKIK